MIHEGNQNNNVAVIVPGIGLTNRVKVKEIITQGGPLGPSACAVTMDKIGKEALEREEYIYK